MTSFRLALSIGQKSRLCRSCGDLSALSLLHYRGFASNLPTDKVTHTGQHWEEEDYRMSRFIGKEKLINENWSIKLINSVPPIDKKDRVVWCDGGGGPTGHPKVYINLDKPGNHSCGYCGLRFVKGSHHH